MWRPGRSATRQRPSSTGRASRRPSSDRLQQADDQYHSLSSFDPQVMGALGDSGTGLALIAATKADHRKLVFIDTIVKGGTQIGLQNTEGGQLEGKALEKSVVPLLGGSWKGKPAVVVGFSAQGASPATSASTEPSARSRRFFRTRSTSSSAISPTTSQPPRTGCATSSWRTRARCSSWQASTTRREEGHQRDPAGQDRGHGPARHPRRRQPGDLESPQALAGLRREHRREALLRGLDWVEAALAVQAGKSFAPYPFSSIITPANVKTYAWRLKIKF